MNLLAVDPITCSQEDRTRARRWLARTLQHPDTVILDTETVDLGAAVCEIAVIDTAGQVLLNTLVNPGMEHRINQEAQQIHGITMDELAAAPSTRTVLRARVRFRWVCSGVSRGLGCSSSLGGTRGGVAGWLRGP